MCSWTSNRVVAATVPPLVSAFHVLHSSPGCTSSESEQPRWSPHRFLLIVVVRQVSTESPPTHRYACFVSMATSPTPTLANHHQFREFGRSRSRWVLCCGSLATSARDFGPPSGRQLGPSD